MPASHRFQSMFVVACVMLAPQPHTNPLANGVNYRNRSLTVAARFRPHADISACYAPGTPQWYVEQFERLIHPPPDPNAYNGSNRWTQTASDGSVFGNGQPITLTYSFPPDNDTGDPSTSNLIHATFDAQFGSRDAWKALFADILADWSAVTGITYVEVGDDGAPWPASAGQLSVRGDVRIVSQTIDGLNNVLAYNYFPNGGDMALDSAENWADSASDFVFLRNIIMHEMGHGFGLGHTLPRDGTKLMEAFINLEFVGPQDDDVRGSDFFYGDTREPNETSAAAVDLGDVPITSVFDNLSLHSTADADWFRVTVIGQQSMAVVAAPVGGAYSVSPDPGTPASVDTRAINPLTVELFDSSGETLLTSRTAAVGESATTAPIAGLSASDTYFVKVLTLGAANDVQRYELTVALGEANTLNVQSTPVAGVFITVSPSDSNGDGSGSTGFSRNYATGESVQLTAPGVSGFHVFQRWIVGGVNQPSGQAVINITMPAAGTTALAEYADLNELTAYAGSDEEVVAGEQVLLKATAIGGDAPLTYAWSPVGTLSTPQSGQTTAEPTETITYTLLVTDSVGRSASDTVTLRVVEPLDVDAGQDQTVLPQKTFTLTGAVTGGTRPYSYEWSPAAVLDTSTNQTAFGRASETTTLTLTVIDAKGRTGSDTLDVVVAGPLAVDAGDEQTVNLGNGAILTASVSGGAEPYAFTWMPGGLAATPDKSVIRVDPSETTVYTLIVTDALGQQATDTVQVNVVSPLVVTIGATTEIEAGETVALDGRAEGGTPPYRYRWSPAEGLSDSQAARPQVSPQETTTYTLVVTDEAGESAEASVQIVVSAAPEAIMSSGGPCGVGLFPVLSLMAVSLAPIWRVQRGP